MNIDNEFTFLEKLRTGIILFTGAGFSKLPAHDGSILPDAQELCGEIMEKFSVSPSAFSGDLERLSNIVNTRARQEFQKYLRKKYTVETYNPLYEALYLINLKAYITTNIDNIIQCVMDNNKRYSLHDITLRGAVKKGCHDVPYIPLHGNVRNLLSRLYFGQYELANVDIDNRDLFEAMKSKLREEPVLFWGYGFHDNAVERAITKLIEDRHYDIWIQTMPGSSNAEYFRALGCNVIEAATEELLKWINEKCNEADFSEGVSSLSEEFNEYSIPNENQLGTTDQIDYFVKAQTDWYSIIYGYPVETRAVSALYESSLRHRNVIAIGMPFSGKTTLMLQLSLKKYAEIKLNVFNITLEQSRRIINQLSGRQALILVDNCCDDIEALRLLMEQKNISVIGFTDDYELESSRHLLSGIDFVQEDVRELDIADAQRIYERIPLTARTDEFSGKKTGEKFSMLEMMGQNVKDRLSFERVRTILSGLREVTHEGFETVALASYLVKNKSALNTDVMFSYFSRKYSGLMRLIDTVQGYLSEFEQDKNDQDYYRMRSNLFAHTAFNVLLNDEDFREDFAEVIRQCVMNVSKIKIYRYDIFKRSAYDAKIFKQLFNDKADELYDYLFRTEFSPYTLQQWALYKASLGRYSEAFADIDRAISMSPNNQSMRNSRAIILFEANRDNNSAQAMNKRREAMSILERCFSSDRRKIYHAQKYAEFAIILAEKYGDTAYLKKSLEWLEQVKSDGSTSRVTDKLYDELRRMCTRE